MTDTASPRGLDPEHFVNVIYRHAFESGVAAAESSVANPPGRDPHPHLLDLHAWWMDLPEGEKNVVRRMMRLAADQAVFGVLCMLDNVRRVSDDPDEQLVLKIEKGGAERRLKEDETVEFHDLFTSLASEGPEE